MLKAELVVIGKLKEEYLRQACDEYIKRLGAFCRVTVTELPESRVSQNPSPSEITDCLEKEGAAILAKIPAQSYMVAMCIEGELLTSPQLAAQIQKAASGGASHISFVIGGSWGLAPAVKKRADLRLSMSPMTFPHQLARVMVLEQLYRAMGINNHTKYHK